MTEDELREELSRMEEENQDLRGEISNLNDTIGELNDRVEELKREANQEASDKRYLEDEFYTTKDRLAESEKKNHQLKSEMAELRSRTHLRGAY